jgi:hypothetical protein
MGEIYGECHYCGRINFLDNTYACEACQQIYETEEDAKDEQIEDPPMPKPTRFKTGQDVYHIYYSEDGCRIAQRARIRDIEDEKIILYLQDDHYCIQVDQKFVQAASARQRSYS